MGIPKLLMDHEKCCHAYTSPLDLWKTHQFYPPPNLHNQTQCKTWVNNLSWLPSDEKIDTKRDHCDFLLEKKLNIVKMSFLSVTNVNCTVLNIVIVFNRECWVKYLNFCQKSCYKFMIEALSYSVPINWMTTNVTRAKFVICPQGWNVSYRQGTI